MHDLVIRGGTVVDGTGAPPRLADVAVDGGIIVAVGDVPGTGREEIDASGRIVTPGFIDLHTHYDAQVMWDPVLAPSAWHGVTTVVTGNCSVGIAPLRKDDRRFPLAVMEAIEEIPADMMEQGIDWDWESFPEYLDALDRRKHTIDIAPHVTHIALRAYVMGDRAEGDEPASEQELAEMERLAEEALRAGAIGISGSRTKAHRYPHGGIVPGTYANERELLGLSDALGRVGEGRVMQYLGNPFDLDHDLPFTRELARRAKGPVHFIMSDTGWQRRLAMAEDARNDGLTLYAHLAPRAVGMIAHWRCVEHPFSEAPSMQAIANLLWEERLAHLKDGEFKARVLAETRLAEHGFFKTYSLDRMFEIADYPDYEPDPAKDSFEAKARDAGIDPLEYAYDVLMRDNGEGTFYYPIANYRSGDLSVARDMLQHPQTVVSLSDGGAHCTRVCDGAAPTFMLAHWSRDRTRGEGLPLEKVVQYLSRDTAASYGLEDRGIIAKGYLADMNVIDFDNLRLPAPYLANDFPGGAFRLLQKAEGYDATIKRGVVTFRNGEHCGTYPGQVVRGPQMAHA